MFLLACLLAGALPALGRITDATVARDDRAIILIANPFGYVPEYFDLLVFANITFFSMWPCLDQRCHASQVCRGWLC